MRRFLRYGVPVLILLVSAAVLAFVWLMPGNNANADQPKFVNPAQTFEPIPDAQARAMVREKLGRPPRMSAEELARVKAGEVVVRKVGGQGERRAYMALATVDHPPAAVMAFMRDYPAKLGIFPNMTAIEAQWNGNMAKVDLTIKVGLNIIKYRLHFRHYGDNYLEFEYAYGDIKDTHGEYKFFPLSGGAKTLLVYRVDTDTGVPLPRFIINLLTKNSLPKMIRAIRIGTERRLAGR